MTHDYGFCSECGAPLAIGERRMCGMCWTAYWNQQLEAVPVERLATAEQAHLEQVGNELVLITANLKQRLVLAERTIEEQGRVIAEKEQVIRLQQERIDNLNEDLEKQSEYLAVVCDKLSQEETRSDGLLHRNNKLAEQLQELEKRNGHLVR